MIAYRLFAYLAFLVSFAALMAASIGVGPVPAIDRPGTFGAYEALAIDLGLVLLLGVQHTIMARAPFKRALSRVLPPEVERSTFVLASSLCVAAIALLWAPIPGEIWCATGAAAATLGVVAFAGYALAGASTFAFDHAELFGLRDARGGATFSTPPLYRVVRHPMMLGMLIGFWVAPHMTVGHVVFAGSMTAYILVGVRYEERDLLRTFGDEYAQYKREIPSLLPWPRPRTNRA